MITIALDEQGDFENIKNERESKPVFIGGIIYDDHNEELDEKNEKRRLQKYFEILCAESNASYPQDLHVRNNGKNSNKVHIVKQKFGKTIGEYLKAGTWQGKQLISEKRKGNYYIFAYVRGKNGKKELLGDDISEAVKEDYASNLYVHMTQDIVERLVFHNPIIKDISKVKFDLATRRVILKREDGSAANKEQYTKLGYLEDTSHTVTVPNGGSAIGNGASEAKLTEYVLTNSYVYRTTLEREMLKSEQKKISIEQIGTKSIYYDHKDSGCRMDFLYLADAICSHLSYNAMGSTPVEWINSFFKEAGKINPASKNMIWAYDETDSYYDNSYRYFENHDYYKAFSLLFDMKNAPGTTAGFYKERWTPIIENTIIEQADSDALSLAIKKFRDSIFKDNLNQAKTAYICTELEKVAENVNFPHRKKEAELYDLFDAGISAYNHLGDSENAARCYEKAKEYAEYIPIETFLATKNRISVCYCDLLKFDKALEIANDNVIHHELLTDFKKEIFGKCFTESLNHAKALSQRGTIYAFMNNDKAEEDFIAALNIMDEGTPDHLITQSYLLHYYISQGMKDKYEPMAADYFNGRNTLEEQLTYLVKEGSKKQNPRFSLKFALFVYIKALYVFYLDEIPERLIKKLTDINESIKKISKNAEKQLYGHPWEIIYKYIVLILKHYDSNAYIEPYISKIEEFSKKTTGILRQISEKSLIVCKECNKLSESPNTELTYMYD